MVLTHSLCSCVRLCTRAQELAKQVSDLNRSIPNLKGHLEVNQQSCKAAKAELAKAQAKVAELEPTVAEVRLRAVRRRGSFA